MKRLKLSILVVAAVALCGADLPDDLRRADRLCGPAAAEPAAGRAVQLRLRQRRTGPL